MKKEKDLYTSVSERTDVPRDVVKSMCMHIFYTINSPSFKNAKEMEDYLVNYVNSMKGIDG